MRMQKWTMAALGLVLAGALVHAQIGFATLEAKDYRSPSGAVVLHVDPTQRSGAGPASYRCTRDGAELWSETLPYTLWDAVVTDDALVAGYAYGAGHDGGVDDSLTIVLLDTDGTPRLEERSERSGFVSDIGPPPNPTVAGLFVDPEDDRLVVRTRGTSGLDETWRAWSLTTGLSHGRLDPRAGLIDDEGFSFIRDARAVPDTPLDLVHWNYRGADWGAGFTLLEADGAVAWRLVWPNDYASDDADDPWQIYNEVQRDGAIVSLGPWSFTLRSWATNENVTFRIEEVEESPGRWKVRESARVPREEAEPHDGAGPTKEPPEITLRHLGSIKIGGEPTAPVLRDVLSYRHDDRGRLGFLRRGTRAVDFVRVDAQGENAVEIPVPAAPEGTSRWYFLANLGERWLVIADAPGGGDQEAWWVDATARTATPLEGFEAPNVKAVAGAPGGGFVVIGSRRHSYTYTNHLVIYGSDGRRIKALGGDQGDSRDPATIFDFNDLTVLDDGRIVVLGNVTKRLQYFSSTGEFLRVIELEELYAPHYPTEVAPDRDGGVIVNDGSAVPPVLRLDREGALVTSLVPRFADGRALEASVRAAPDGSLWATDGVAIYALDDQGRVRHTLGAAPDAQVLGDVDCIALGPDDRIHALDSRTGTVHVFDAEGKPLHTCTSREGDFGEPRWISQMTVTDAGEVWIGDLHFGADGTRLGRGEAPVTGISAERHARRGSEGLWVLEYESITLLGSNDEVVRALERTPDGRWLSHLGPADVAPDGSLAVATSEFMGSGSPGIHFYAANGEPIRTVPTPCDGLFWLAWDGQRLVVCPYDKGGRGAVLLLDAFGRELGRFVPERRVDGWHPFFAADGTELWLFDGPRTIERYALP